jgi:hypothetical protein
MKSFNKSAFLSPLSSYLLALLLKNIKIKKELKLMKGIQQEKMLTV